LQRRIRAPGLQTDNRQKLPCLPAIGIGVQGLAEQRLGLLELLLPVELLRPPELLGKLVNAVPLPGAIPHCPNSPYDKRLYQREPAPTIPPAVQSGEKTGNRSCSSKPGYTVPGLEINTESAHEDLDCQPAYRLVYRAQRLR